MSDDVRLIAFAEEPEMVDYLRYAGKHMDGTGGYWNFTEEELGLALEAFARRQRRFGRTEEQVEDPGEGSAEG